MADRIGLDILLGQVTRPAPSCDSLSENIAGAKKNYSPGLLSNSNTLSPVVAVFPPFFRDLAGGDGAWKLEFVSTARRVRRTPRRWWGLGRALRSTRADDEMFSWSQDVGAIQRTVYASCCSAKSILSHPRIQPSLLPSARLRRVGTTTCQQGLL